MPRRYTGPCSAPPDQALPRLRRGHRRLPWSPPTTTASARSAPPAARSTTRTRSTWSARCRCGATRCCCAARHRAAPRPLDLPAGFLELGESTEEGACRETDEEAGARIELGPLFTVLNVVPAGQVHLFYRARMLDTRFDPGPESLEAACSPSTNCPGTRSPSAPSSRPCCTTSPTAHAPGSSCTLAMCDEDETAPDLMPAQTIFGQAVSQSCACRVAMPRERSRKHSPRKTA
jgi:hypothetical protein